MPLGGTMMWRFSTLFNYIRGGVRSGAWRVREPPSQLISDDREDREDEEQAAVGAPPSPPRRCRAPSSTATPLQTVTCGLPTRRAAAGAPPTPAAVHLPPAAALWFLGLAAQQTPAATAALGAPATPVTRAAPETPAAPVTPSDSADPVACPAPALAADDAEPLDTLSSLRAAFAAEHDRLMASLQNAAGAGVAISRPQQALECFRAAAALGSPAAWFNCGVCFQQGRGADVDMEKAAVCYQEAARLGHVAAGYNLALLVADGRVTSHHDVTDLLQRAAVAGSAEAAAFLDSWRAWSEEQETEDDELRLCSPGRSVSLPVLTAACTPEPEPWCGVESDDWPAVRPPALFYLHESP